MSPCSRQQMAARLLSSPGLQHDQAQAALASSLSSTAMESPGALLDEASLSLFGAAGLDVAAQASASPTCSPTSSASAPTATTTGRC